MSTNNKVKDTLLITGSSGFVGGHLTKQASSTWKVVGTRHQNDTPLNGASELIQMDITDKNSVMSAIKEISPSVVIHCAAITNAEYCAKNKKLSEAVNITGTENIVLAAVSVGAHLIFVSSDLVFDGNDGYYNESALPNPICLYGKTKLEGEKIVNQINNRYAIARLAWTYGKSINYSKNFLDRMIDNLEQKQQINLFFDEYRSPVYVQDLCDSLLALAKSRMPGIFHLAGPERISRLDFGYKVAECFGFDKSLIIGTSSDSIDFLDRRPKDCSLVSTRTISSHISFRTIEDVLTKIKNF
jgi:dTDP-4-dehydrorhamnose reductase